MNDQNLIFYSLLTGAAFLVVIGFQTKKAPSLPSFFSTVLAMASIFSGIDLIWLVYQGQKSLGDFSNYRLIIILGGISVVWVAISSIHRNYFEEIRKLRG